MNLLILTPSGALINGANIREIRAGTTSVTEGRRGHVGAVIAIMDDGERKVLFDSSRKVGEGVPTVEESEKWAQDAFVKLQKQIVGIRAGGILDIPKFLETLPGVVVEYPTEPDEPGGAK